MSHINSLIREGEAIQKRLKRKKQTKDHKEKVFVRLMLKGKVSAALRWIGKESTSVLEVTDKELQILKDKHPSATPASEDAILNGPKTKVEDVVYEMCVIHCCLHNKIQFKMMKNICYTEFAARQKFKRHC